MRPRPSRRRSAHCNFDCHWLARFRPMDASTMYGRERSPRSPPCRSSVATASLARRAARRSTGCAVGPTFKTPQVTVNDSWRARRRRPRHHADRRRQPCGGRRSTTRRSIAWSSSPTSRTCRCRSPACESWRPARSSASPPAGSFPRCRRPFGSATAHRAQPRTSSTSPASTATPGSYQLGFDAAWELDFWGKYRRGVEAEAANLLASVADYYSALVSLTAEVARTYVVIRTFEVLIAQAEREREDPGGGRCGSPSPASATARPRSSIRPRRRRCWRAPGPPSPSCRTGLAAGAQRLEHAARAAAGHHRRAARGHRRRSRRRPRRWRSACRPRCCGGVRTSAAPSCTPPRSAPASASPRPSSIRASRSSARSASQASSSGSGVAQPLLPRAASSTRVGPQINWPFLNYGRLTNGVRVEDARFQQLLVSYRDTVLKAAQEVEDALTGFSTPRRRRCFEQARRRRRPQRSVEIAARAVPGRRRGLPARARRRSARSCSSRTAWPRRSSVGRDQPDRPLQGAGRRLGGRARTSRRADRTQRRDEAADQLGRHAVRSRARRKPRSPRPGSTRESTMAKKSRSGLCKWIIAGGVAVAIVAFIGFRYWKAKQTRCPRGSPRATAGSRASSSTSPPRSRCGSRRSSSTKAPSSSPVRCWRSWTPSRWRHSWPRPRRPSTPPQEKLASPRPPSSSRRARSTSPSIEVERSQRLVAAGRRLAAGARRPHDEAGDDQGRARGGGGDAADRQAAGRGRARPTRRRSRRASTTPPSSPRSPGRVLYRLAEPGEVLAAGGKALTLVNLEDVYMEIFLPSEQAASVKVGAEGRITVDYDCRSAPSPATSASSRRKRSSRPSRSRRSSEREKLMFRVKIQLPKELVEPVRRAHQDRRPRRRLRQGQRLRGLAGPAAEPADVAPRGRRWPRDAGDSMASTALADRLAGAGRRTGRLHRGRHPPLRQGRGARRHLARHPQRHHGRHRRARTASASRR